MRVVKLTTIGIIAGAILAGCMKLIFILTGNEAYQLLYNMDYIPFIHVYNDSFYFRIFFHYIFCIISVISLFYVLHFFQLYRKPILYIIIYTVGAGALFFITLLTSNPPTAHLFMSWFYWTFSHVLFGVTVGLLVKKWIY